MEIEVLPHHRAKILVGHSGLSLSPACGFAAIGDTRIRPGFWVRPISKQTYSRDCKRPSPWWAHCIWSLSRTGSASDDSLACSTPRVRWDAEVLGPVLEVFASRYGHSEVVDKLLDKGANIEAKFLQGWHVQRHPCFDLSAHLDFRSWLQSHDTRCRRVLCYKVILL